MILLRWSLPLEPIHQRRALTTLLATLDAYATPLYGLLGYYASRHSDPYEAWFTAFADDEYAVVVAGRIGVHFPGTLTRSTTDKILGDDLAWYRLRLQHITDISLSVTEDQHNGSYKRLKRAMHGLLDPAGIPEGQAEAELYKQVLEGPLTAAAAEPMSRAVSSVETDTGFWSDFVRWPQRDKDTLSPPGHWLWNLAL